FSRAAYVVLFALRAFPTRRSSDLLFQMIRCRLQSPGSLMKNHFQICIVFHQSFGSQCLDTAHTCCHTCFGNNLEGSDGCSIVHRSEEHTSELQSRFDLVCRLLLEK